MCNAATGGMDMRLISVQELKEKLDRGDPLKLVNALGEWEYRAAHIPGSLHFATPEETLRKLGRDDEIVVHCSNPSCMASVALYQLLERNGYRNLRRFAGGLQEWQQAGYRLEGDDGGCSRRRTQDLSGLDTTSTPATTTSARWSPARTGAGGSSIRSASRPSSAASARCRRVARVAEFFSDRTAWVRRLQTPLRQFLRTETGGAAVLLAAAVAALAWANLDVSSYEELWGTELSLALGDQGLELSLREWVNSGLMTFFFFVLGLEARREFDLGELRERRRLALPMLAAIGGMAAAVAIYLAFNLGGLTARGWGIAMSTDTALALGLLGLAGRRVPDRLRAFILTVVVVDDLLALVVIATAYTDGLELAGLGWAVGCFAAVLGFRAIGVRWGPLYLVLGAAGWVALLASGVEPVVVGLAMGLLVWAYPAGRSEFERAGERFRAFREQPTPELERSARQGLSAAISPNERLVHLYHPWTSYVIVPLFAFANAGIAIDAGLLERAAGSPVTLGILVGYLIGKPVGILGVSLLVTRLSRGRLRPPVGWAAVLGAGTVAGVGFTISLLVATLAFDGPRLEEAKIGILGAAGGASALTWLVFGATALLPRQRRVAALLGGEEPLVDLAYQVDPDRDHVRGPLDAPVTVVEYGDFECPVLRPGGTRSPRAAARLRRRALRLAAPAPGRRAPQRPARRRGLGGRRRPGRVLADARPAAGASGRAGPHRPGGLRRPARARPRALHRPSPRARRCQPNRRGCRGRRPQRRLRHPDLFHQRAPPLRRLRRRRPLGRRPWGRRAGELATP